MSLTLDVIRQLPKAELHCHLDGFCRPTTIIELAKEQGVELPTWDLEELKHIMTVPRDCVDLVQYLKTFDNPLLVMQQPYAITRIFYEACEDAYKDGISYLELRFAPALHTGNGHSYSQILEAAIDGIHLAEKKFGIVARILCCAMRHMDPEVNREIAEICWRYSSRGVVGFDLAGPENGFPPGAHVAGFKIIRQKSVSLTIHAGEAYGAASIKEAINCNTNRIGHGTHIVGNEELIQTVVDRRLPIEMCITSNLQTKAITKLEEHPIRELFNRGVICVPCTDNPTVSGVTLSEEYELIQSLFKFNIEEIMRLIDYGFRSAFVDEKLKQRLRVDAFTKSMRILQQNGIDITPIIANQQYYNGFGVSVPPVFCPPVKQPALTLELIKALPKCDVDCRLIGSVPIKTLFELYQKNGYTEYKDFDSFEAFIYSDPTEMFIEQKRLATALLNSAENTKTAVEAVIADAVADNVRYMELTVSPVAHETKTFKAAEFLDAVLAVVEKAENIAVKVVLSANIKALAPVAIHRLAELAVEYKARGVVGFATTTEEISEETMKYYLPTFEYLRKNFINVSIFAGETNPLSVPTAIVEGNARRLSGGFNIPANTAIVRDVTSHNTFVCVSLTPRIKRILKGISDTPIRFLFDFNVRVAFCSIHNAFRRLSRSEQLNQIAIQSGFSALDVVQILSNTFSAVFLPYEQMRTQRTEFWNEAIAILKKDGFTQFFNCVYFPQE